MPFSPALHPQQVCEDLLRAEQRYNIEHRILPSENAIADRLLARGTELKTTYEELHGKLRTRQSLQIFLQLVLSAAAFWNPEKSRAARAARDHLADVNRKIAAQAAELAGLLEQRSSLHTTSGFLSDTHYHIGNVIKAASRDNPLFRSYLQEKLDALCYQFDLKYWPSLSECLHELASDAEEAALEPTDPLTAASTAASRPSLADFVKALLAAIDENGAEYGGHLPRGFKLTDRALASLTNCALDLDPEALVDESYMKRLRQRERSGGA